MQHGPEFTIILLFTIVLGIGAATRLLSRWTQIPYTIAMLLFGTAAGVALEEFGGERGLFGIFQLPADGMIVSPGLIIFIFLPALLFESSYDLDGHLFKKNLGAISVLAGPAMLACIFLTAALMMWLTQDDWKWGWIPALTFGALISATDPVAVVAILKEAGAPKRLGTLIEGESLLNDGTAIVVFTVLVGLLAPESIGAHGLSGDDVHLGSTILQFIKVVAGGLLVGLILSYIFSNWIGKTFNDPLVEITLTMVLGYLGMLIAEGMLHVSGVMAIVISGLWMGGIGRTKISPEVQDFLHKFWRLLAYIANTIIFFLVGLIVATQVNKVGVREILCIVACYLGIMVIRFAVTFSARPFFAAMRNPVDGDDAVVLAWGGLRGAVSLALALIIASNDNISQPLRQQILVLTVGVVVLTILINGTTVGILLKKLRLTDPPLTVRLGTQSARVTVLEEVHDRVDAVSTSPGMRGMNWGDVKEHLGQRLERENAELTRLQHELARSGREHQIARSWREALNLEREAYWEFFAMGILAARPVTILNHEIETQLDRIDRGLMNPPARRTPKLESRVERWTRKIGRQLNLKSLQYDYLSLLYSVSRAENMAASAVINGFRHVKGIDDELREEILAVYSTYLSGSNKRLEEMRHNLPEVTASVESALANRVALNYERDGYDNLLHHGRLDESIAITEMERVEEAMKRLLYFSRWGNMPTTEQLLKEVPMFRFCAECSRTELAGLVEETLVPAGEFLFREGSRGDRMFIVVRGAVEVTTEHDGQYTLLGVLGGGDIIGEMALLTGERRNASARAVTTVTLLQITRSVFDPFTETHPDVRDEIWNAYCGHLLNNTLRHHPAFSSQSVEDRKALEESARHTRFDACEVARVEPGDTWLFVATGKLEAGGKEYGPGSIIDLRFNHKVIVLEETRMVWLTGPVAAH